MSHDQIKPEMHNLEMRQSETAQYNVMQKKKGPSNRKKNQE